MSSDRMVAELMLIADETYDYAGFIVGLISAKKMKAFVGKDYSVVVVRIPTTGWITCRGGKAEFDQIVSTIETAVRVEVVGMN